MSFICLFLYNRSSKSSSTNSTTNGVPEKKKKEKRSWSGSLSSQKIDNDVTRSLNYNLQDGDLVANGVMNGDDNDIDVRRVMYTCT